VSRVGPYTVGLGLVLIVATVLRLLAFTHVDNGGIRITGVCSQLFDEVKPLFDARNPLHFDVFFYPPVAPIIVAATALVLQKFTSTPLDLGLYCLFVSIGISLVTVGVVYLIGKEWTPSIGLAAAAFYAVTMIAVTSCSNVQVYPTFFAMLAIYWFLKSLDRPTFLNLAFMGVSLGLAIASKYFPAMLSLMLLLVHFVAKRDQLDSKGVTSIHGESPVYQRPFANTVWRAFLYGALLVIVVSSYVGLFHRASVMDFLKVVYERESHAHPFEYHLATIENIYHGGQWMVGILGVVVAMGIGIPSIKGMRHWDWSLQFYRHNRLWALPVIAMMVTVMIAIGIPVALNVNSYAKYTTWVAKAYGSADGGMFPQGRPAPSYLFSFIPENLGLPLFFLACGGIVLSLYRRDRKALLLIATALPLYIGLELSSVKVNRYAFDLMPLFCVFGAIVLWHVWSSRPRVPMKLLSWCLFLAVFTYSFAYSLAWADLVRPQRDLRVETANWMAAHVPKGARVGIRTNFWVDGSPDFLPDENLLQGYEPERYSNYPDYILLPKLLYALMKQYSELAQSGYIYTARDWSPLPAPDAGEKALIMDLINQDTYELIEEFYKVPSLLGIEFGSQALGGRTWFLEHLGASYGILIYRKRASHEAALDIGQGHV